MLRKVNRSAKISRMPKRIQSETRPTNLRYFTYREALLDIKPSKNQSNDRA